MQAVIQYGKIVSWLEMEYGLSERESKASESLLLAAFLNLAMCYLKLREYIKAIEYCNKVKTHLTSWSWGSTIDVGLQYFLNLLNFPSFFTPVN